MVHTFFLRSALFLSFIGAFFSCTGGPMSLVHASDAPILGESAPTQQENILGKSTEDLRDGNITMEDIPLMIASVIEYLLVLAGSISVVALIYHAFRMQLASGITGDASGVDKAKSGMKGAVLGFILSMSAWFLMTKFVAIIAANTQ